MARLRMRLIRFGDRDGLGTSEATRTRGGPSVSRSLSPHRHELPGYGIRSDWELVLGADEGIPSVPTPDVVSRPPRRFKRRPTQDDTYTQCASVTCVESV